MGLAGASRALCFGLALLVACGAPAAAPTSREEPPASDDSPERAREECAAIMLRTRACAAEHVPGLLALRVRLDRPPGIAARVEAVGEEAILAQAHEEHARDWSDEAIRANCDALIEMPAGRREAILEPERACLEAPDCATFTACDLANKERRWTAAEVPREE